MPILIRIILQRLLLAVFSVLAFFGINPDLTIPSDEVVQEIREKQQERVDQILSPETKPVAVVVPDGTVKTPTTPVPPAITEIEEKITDIQKEFNQTITIPFSQKAQEIIPQSTIPSVVSNKPSEETITAPTFEIKEVVVNILCLEKTSAYTRMTSGSGVVISNNGLVLTNAHVAYPFLRSRQFGDNTYTCSVRRGGISNFGYNAELVYYPLDWLRYNSEIIKEPTPIGTGEDDYAILLITTPAGLGPKTSYYPAASLSVTSSDLKRNVDVTVAGYPSSNSGVFEIDTNPGLKTAQTLIEDFFTFSSRSYDVLQTGPNSVAKRGSSGGGVFKDDKLFGLVVTTNDDGRGQYLNALTLPYIKEDFENDTGMDLDKFVTTSLDILQLRFSVSYKQALKDIISGN